MVRVKICGITNLDDALAVVEAGADALGFVFYDKSPRCIAPENAAEIVKSLPPFITTVGLFVNANPDFVNSTVERCLLDRVQLHGDESPEYCVRIDRPVVKVIRIRGEESLLPMKDYHVSAFLLDAYSPRAYGGTGLTFNWDLARNAKKFGPIILAGGLTAANVRECVVQVQPYAVDVSSGVEASPGRKDPAKVKEFIKRVKGFVEEQ